MAKRRSKGEGSIFYLDSKELWVGQITLPDGKRKLKYSKKQSTVREWLLEKRRALKDGTFVDDESVTVAQYFTHYLHDVAVHSVRPKTFERYEGLYRLHIKPQLGRIKLSKLRPDHLQGLYSLKLSEGQSKRSVQQLHAVIHKGLDQALKWGLVSRNVSDLVTAPKPDKRIPPILSKDQVSIFLEAARSTNLYPLYVLAIDSGMRQGELLGLLWEDVDLNRGKIHVRNTAQTLWKEGIVFTEPKTDKAKRSIKISKSTVKVLKQHKADQETIKTEAWPFDLVFPTKTGKPISGRNLLTYFHRVLEKAGLPKMRFHDLRHTSATLLLSAGVHPKIVQERLGHSQIGLTLDTYSHVLPTMQEQAAKEMEDILG